MFLWAFFMFSVYVDFSTCKDVAPGISEDLYCEGCIATVKELVKMMNKKSSDPKDLVITEALESICKPYNFVEYKYSPPKTVKACELLLERNEEEIEAVLAKNSKDIEDQICYKLSKACLNVKRSEKLEKPVDADVVINGDTKKAEFKYDVDSMTGSVKEVKGHVKEEPKTLSKKDKKSKKVKKDKTKKKKVENKKDPVDFFQLDLNDPDSMNKVMAQIQEATKEHTKEFYRKKEEEETIKEEEEERKQTEGKDEL